MKRRDLTSFDVLRSTKTYNTDCQTVASINALGNSSTSIYDAGGRGVASVDAKGNRSTTVYDTKGRAAASINPLGKRWTTIFNTVGQTVGSKDPLGNRSTSVYDTAGRVVASINPLGKRATTVYNIASQSLATIDANGNRVSSVYDALGRRTVEVNALGNRTTTIYNSLGQTSALVDARANRHSFTFDSTGAQTQLIDPLNRRTTSAYDAAGQQSLRIDAWGNPITSSGSTVNPFRWVGRYGYYQDSSTGLVYVRARMYQPGNSRWVSADPIGFLDGLNLYQNVRNAPVALFDPTGLFLARVHTQITEAVINAWISRHAMSEACEQWIRSVVTCCNLAKDFGSAFNSLEQHYNRPFAGNDESWGARISAGRKADTAYGVHLSNEQSKLDSQIEHSDCYQALCTMGRLSHSYQDFYAHAVRVDQGGTTFYVNARPPGGDISKPIRRLGSLIPPRSTRDFDGRQGSENSVWPGFSAFEDGFTADPGSRLGFMPSSYEYGQEGEHPGNTEPLRVGSAEERTRIQHAQLYTQTKLHSYLDEWWQRCQCPCPQAGQPCTLIRPAILQNVPWALLGVPEYCPRQ